MRDAFAAICTLVAFVFSLINKCCDFLLRLEAPPIFSRSLPYNPVEDCVMFVTACCVGLPIYLLYKCCTYLFGKVRESIGWPYLKSHSRLESASDPLDLHGYGVNTALAKLKEYLEYKKEAGRLSVTVITGRGNHSQNYRAPVLRPNVIKWLKAHDFRGIPSCLCYEAHDGTIKVYL